MPAETVDNQRDNRAQVERAGFLNDRIPERREGLSPYEAAQVARQDALANLSNFNFEAYRPKISPLDFSSMPRTGGLIEGALDSKRTDAEKAAAKQKELDDLVKKIRATASDTYAARQQRYGNAMIRDAERERAYWGAAGQPTQVNIRQTHNFHLGAFANSRYPQYKVGAANEENYARLQTRGEKLRHGFGKFATKTLIYGIGGVGNLITGTLSAITQARLSAFYDNSFNNFMLGLADYMGDKLPNYYTQEERNMNFFRRMGTANFWASDVIGDALSFTTGAFLTAYLTGGLGLAGLSSLGARGAGIFGRLAGAGARAASKAATNAAGSAGRAVAGRAFGASRAAALRTGSRNIKDMFKPVVRKITKGASIGNSMKTISTLGFGSAWEASVEANAVFKQNEEDFKEYYRTIYNRDPSEQEMSEFYETNANISNGVFAANMLIVGASNLWQFGRYMGIGGKFVDRTVARPMRSLKNLTDRYLFGIGVKRGANGAMEVVKGTRAQKFAGTVWNVTHPMLAEGVFEEGLQGVASRAAEDYVKSRYDKTYLTDTVDFMDSIGKGFHETYTTDEGLVEVGIGAIIGGGMHVRNRFGLGQREARVKALEEAVKNYNENRAFTLEQVKDVLRNTATLTSMSAHDEFSGDTIFGDTNSSNAEFNKFALSDEMGMLDSHAKDFRNLVESLDNEELASELGVDEEQAAKLKESIIKDYNRKLSLYKEAESFGSNVVSGTRYERYSPYVAQVYYSGASAYGRIAEIADMIEEIVGDGSSNLSDSLKVVSSLRNETLSLTKELDGMARELEALEREVQSVATDPNRVNDDGVDTKREEILKRTEALEAKRREYDEKVERLRTMSAEDFNASRFGQAVDDLLASESPTAEQVLSAYDAVSFVDTYMRGKKTLTAEDKALRDLVREYRDNVTNYKNLRNLVEAFTDSRFAMEHMGMLTGLISRHIKANPIDTGSRTLANPQTATIDANIDKAVERGELTEEEAYTAKVFNHLGDRINEAEGSGSTEVITEEMAYGWFSDPDGYEQAVRYVADKINNEGEDSLTENERRFFDRSRYYIEGFRGQNENSTRSNIGRLRRRVDDFLNKEALKREYDNVIDLVRSYLDEGTQERFNDLVKEYRKLYRSGRSRNADEIKRVREELNDISRSYANIEVADFVEGSIKESLAKSLGRGKQGSSVTGKRPLRPGSGQTVDNESNRQAPAPVSPTPVAPAPTPTPVAPAPDSGRQGQSGTTVTPVDTTTGQQDGTGTVETPPNVSEGTGVLGDTDSLLFPENTGGAILPTGDTDSDVIASEPTDGRDVSTEEPTRVMHGQENISVPLGVKGKRMSKGYSIVGMSLEDAYSSVFGVSEGERSTRVSVDEDGIHNITLDNGDVVSVRGYEGNNGFEIIGNGIESLRGVSSLRFPNGNRAYGVIGSMSEDGRYSAFERGREEGREAVDEEAVLSLRERSESGKKDGSTVRYVIDMNDPANSSLRDSEDDTFNRTAVIRVEDADGRLLGYMRPAPNGKTNSVRSRAASEAKPVQGGRVVLGEGYVIHVERGTPVFLVDENGNKQNVDIPLSSDNPIVGIGYFLNGEMHLNKNGKSFSDDMAKAADKMRTESERNPGRPVPFVVVEVKDRNGSRYPHPITMKDTSTLDNGVSGELGTLLDEINGLDENASYEEVAGLAQRFNVAIEGTAADTNAMRVPLVRVTVNENAEFDISELTVSEILPDLKRKSAMAARILNSLASWENDGRDAQAIAAEQALIDINLDGKLLHGPTFGSSVMTEEASNNVNNRKKGDEGTGGDVLPETRVEEGAGAAENNRQANNRESDKKKTDRKSRSETVKPEFDIADYGYTKGNSKQWFSLLDQVLQKPAVNFVDWVCRQIGKGLRFHQEGRATRTVDDLTEVTSLGQLLQGDNNTTNKGGSISINPKSGERGMPINEFPAWLEKQAAREDADQALKDYWDGIKDLPKRQRDQAILRDLRTILLSVNASSTTAVNYSIDQYNSEYVENERDKVSHVKNKGTEEALEKAKKEVDRILGSLGQRYLGEQVEVLERTVSDPTPENLRALNDMMRGGAVDVLRAERDHLPESDPDTDAKRRKIDAAISVLEDMKARVEGVRSLMDGAGMSVREINEDFVKLYEDARNNPSFVNKFADRLVSEGNTKEAVFDFINNNFALNESSAQGLRKHLKLNGKSNGTGTNGTGSRENAPGEGAGESDAAGGQAGAGGPLTGSIVASGGNRVDVDSRSVGVYAEGGAKIGAAAVDGYVMADGNIYGSFAKYGVVSRPSENLAFPESGESVRSLENRGYKNVSGTNWFYYAHNKKGNLVQRYTMLNIETGEAFGLTISKRSSNESFLSDMGTPDMVASLSQAARFDVGTKFDVKWTNVTLNAREANKELKKPC